MEELQLERLGLTKIEARVYLTLLKIGSTKTGLLIKKTGLHRATIYDVLKRLIEKGLVSYIIKGKIKYFQITSPEYFLDKLKEDENNLKEKEVFVKSLVGKLKKIKEETKIKEESSIYEGFKGMKVIFNDILESKEYVCLGSTAKLKDILGNYFYIFQNRKKQLKIKARLLFDKSLKNSEYLKDIYGEIKYLPKEYGTPISTFIYDDKIVIIITKEIPVAFLLENKEVANSFKNYFELLWKIAKKV
jgi:sugar-specific transcriptional regulator TrmB